jgi:DNA-binding response OmpR family regulator
MVPSTKNICVIEDSPAIADLLSWALDLEGYNAFVLANGDAMMAWIDKVAQSNDRPILVLIDLDSLPKMKGIASLQQFRSLWEARLGSFPPLIALMAHTENVGEPGYPVIQKPFHIRTLLDEIKKM